MNLASLVGRDGTPLCHLSGHSGTRTRNLPCIDIVVDAGALPFKSYASCDSFLAGESDPVWADGRPLLTLS